MNDLVLINGQEVQRIEYKGDPIVTMPMVDELHERPKGTTRRAFNQHKEKLIEGTDYFRVPYEEWSKILCGETSSEGDPEVFCDSGSSGNNKVAGGETSRGYEGGDRRTNFVRRSDSKDEEGPQADYEEHFSRTNFVRLKYGNHRGEMIFITKYGYLMIVKTFNDKLAWKVQRQLVTRYFESESYRPGMGAVDQQALSRMCVAVDKKLRNKTIFRVLKHYYGIPVDDLLRENEVLSQKKRAPSMDMVTLIDFYLHALMESGPEKWGLQAGVDNRGYKYFMAVTQQLVEIFNDIGKQREFPDFPLTAVQLGVHFSKDREEFIRLGWEKSKVPAKTIKGVRIFRYTFIDPEGPLAA